MKEHLWMSIPSTAVMANIGDRFRRAVRDFAAADTVPVVRFNKDGRHIDVIRPYLDAAVAIGCAQEYQSVFTRHPSVRE